MIATGDIIAARRVLAGLSAAELGRRTGLGQQRIWQLEHGWRGSAPTVRTLQTLARELHCEWHELVGTPRRVPRRRERRATAEATSDAVTPRTGTS
jgi:transcriptional regulator with XRE-family HTH domain